MDDRRDRELALEAAALLVQEGRVEVLSPDLVAEAAGLEPARIRTLFPDVETLVVALLERLFETFQQAVMDACGDDEEPGAWLRAYVRTGMQLDADGSFSSIARAVLCSTAYRPHFVDVIRDSKLNTENLMLESGVLHEDVLVIRAAIEGVFLSRVFGIDIVSDPMRDAVEGRLIGMIDEAVRMQRGAA